MRQRVEPGGPDWLDIAIAVVCFGAFTGPVLAGVTSGIGSLPAIAGFGAAAVAPLLLRRRLPVAVVFAVAAVLCVAAVAGVRFTPWVSNAGPAFGVAVLTLADRRPRRESLIVTGLALAALYVAGIAGFQLHTDQDQNFVQLLVAVPAWLAGDMLRTRRAYRRDLRAQQRARDAEAEARIRAEERLRVSRDVHDLVSHTLSMVAVRSGVARLVMDEQPEEARRALATIETASRSALHELRSVLAQIREPGAREEEPGEPGLAEIGGLIDRIGLTVDYRVSGTPADYPALLQTTVYRIVQEALTNVVKHARTDRATIEMQHRPHELTVQICDDGPAPGAAQHALDDSGSGLGLPGMRERVALFGGRFEAGPRAAGGFAVTANFPIEQDGPHA